MATVKTKPITEASIEESLKVVYKKRHFLFFTWHEVQKTTSIGKDLMVDTKEEYENFYVNGEKYVKG